MARVFVAVGSNLGDRRSYLNLARRSMARLPQTRLVSWSKVYETAPVGPVVQGSFLNAAAELQTSLDPASLWEALRDIECQAGRKPVEQRIRWGPRTLDLDLLLYDCMILSEYDLVIPHPLMHQRDFVLRPLLDLDPKLVHPILEMTVAELLNYVGEQLPNGAPSSRTYVQPTLDGQ